MKNEEQSRNVQYLELLALLQELPLDEKEKFFQFGEKLLLENGESNHE